MTRMLSSFIILTLYCRRYNVELRVVDLVAPLLIVCASIRED